MPPPPLVGLTPDLRLVPGSVVVSPNRGPGPISRPRRVPRYDPEPRFFQTPGLLPPPPGNLPTIPNGNYRATPAIVGDIIPSPDMMPHLIQALQALTDSTKEGRRQNIPTPIFDGTIDIHQFFRDFELVAEHNSWAFEEMSLRLRLALRGDVSKQELSGTYLKLRGQLLGQYEVSEDKAHFQIRKLK